MTALLLLVALVMWAAGACLDLVVGPGRRSARLAPYLAGIAGSCLVTAAGVMMDLGRAKAVDLGSIFGVGQTSLRLDPLAGMFLTLVGGLSVAVSACLVSWAGPDGRVSGRGRASGYLLLLGAVVVILVAADAFTFMFAWEALTLAFYLLVGVERRSANSARASWVTLGIGQLSGAALVFGFLLLAGRARSYSFSAWHALPAGPLHDVAFALIIAGLGAKVGLVPLQVWLPVGYPRAPGPVRAALAGVAVNVGFYGLWRFLGILGHPPIWMAATVLVLGGITALLGIVFAAVQQQLNRVFAYSSVESAGVVFVGYGIALAGAATHRSSVIAIGLVAASLQVLAHAVAKSALFASSAFFQSDFGTDDLEVLGGVGRRAPWSATACGLGSITLAGLPPSIGFVAEWFILEALMQEYRLHDLALRLAMALAGALVALTAGVALLCFIRVVGLSLLGGPARPRAGARLDGGAFGRAGLVLLGLSCLGLAAGAPWVVRFMSDGLAPVVPHSATIEVLRGAWVLQPVFANFSALSPSWLFVLIPAGLLVVGAGTLALSGGRLLRIRRVPAWRSATPGISGARSYTPFGYANVLRHVLAIVLGTKRSSIGPAALPAPASGEVEAHVEVRSDLVEPVEAYLYRPARAAWLWFARAATRLQSGRLDAYVGYMLIALVVLIVVVAAMG